MKLVLACLSFTALPPSFVWETGHKTTPTVLPEMPLLVQLWRLHSCILWCFHLYIFLIFIIMQCHLYSGKWIRPVSDAGLATIYEFRKQHHIEVKSQNQSHNKS